MALTHFSIGIWNLTKTSVEPRKRLLSEERKRDVIQCIGLDAKEQQDLGGQPFHSFQTQVNQLLIVILAGGNALVLVGLEGNKIVHGLSAKVQAEFLLGCIF